jgi:hypothetical protein
MKIIYPLIILAQLVHHSTQLIACASLQQKCNEINKLELEITKDLVSLTPYKVIHKSFKTKKYAKNVQNFKLSTQNPYIHFVHVQKGNEMAMQIEIGDNNIVNIF